ncbi:MAG: very short patch repair endonuclease [Opitutaceae bacterium]
MSAKERSAMMARVRQRHTAPELVVRSILHRLGLRFTVSGPLNRTLPSRPDIVLPRWRTVILVHGCFWHQHLGCKLTTTPTNRAPFWQKKFSDNVSRDMRQRRLLKRAGWKIIVVWECQTRVPDRLGQKIQRIFGGIPKGIMPATDY